MAELSGNVLGKLSGKIGNITARIRNGKNYLASRPGSFIPGKDDASIARRQKFGLIVKFSKAVLTIDDLKTIWKKEKPNNISAFNYVVKVNYNFIENGSLSPANFITPSHGFNPGFSNLALTSSLLSMELDPLSNVGNFNTEIEKEIKLCAVLFFSNPSVENMDNYFMLSLKSNNAALQLNDPTSFTVNLNNLPINIYNTYSSKQVFIAALTIDDNAGIVQFSNTYHYQF